MFLNIPKELVSTISTAQTAILVSTKLEYNLLTVLLIFHTSVKSNIHVICETTFISHVAKYN